MDSNKIDNISGIDGHIFPWIFPEKFLSNRDFLREFFGEELLARYKGFKSQNFEFNHVKGNKAEIVIKIISNIASVHQELFARSLISKILSREIDSSQALLAEQSDDEREEVNAALLYARALAKSPDA